MWWGGSSSQPRVYMKPPGVPIASECPIGGPGSTGAPSGPPSPDSPPSSTPANDSPALKGKASEHFKEFYVTGVVHVTYL